MLAYPLDPPLEVVCKLYFHLIVKATESLTSVSNNKHFDLFFIPSNIVTWYSLPTADCFVIFVL